MTFHSRADQNPNWRSRERNTPIIPTCRYCKREGHDISECPTRPPRRNEQFPRRDERPPRRNEQFPRRDERPPRRNEQFPRRDERPPKKDEPNLAEMFWPTLDEKESPIMALQGTWGGDSLVSKINTVETENEQKSLAVVKTNNWKILGHRQ